MTLLARQTAWRFLSSGRFALQTARNIAALPRVFRTLANVVTETAFEPDAEELRAQLLLPLAPDTEARDREERRNTLIRLFRAGEWDKALSRLHDWDENRRRSHGRSSYIAEALLAVPDCVQDSPALIEAFEGAFGARPDDHVMAACLAMAHTGLGWQARGDGYVEDISPIGAERFTAHFARAAEILSQFDPVERLSPALAIAQYHLYACHPEADEMIHDWFADWVDLDPGTVNPYLIHGFHLLPRWFGEDAGALDRAALHAAAEASDTLGAAAYALLYLGTIEEVDPEGLACCDADFLLEGLETLFEITDSPHLANRMALRLYRAANMRLVDPGPPETATAIAALQTRLREGFRLILRKHLSVGLPEVWGSEDDMLYCIAQGFAEELRSGAVIRFDGNGAKIDAPAA